MISAKSFFLFAIRYLERQILDLRLIYASMVIVRIEHYTKRFLH